MYSESKWGVREEEGGDPVSEKEMERVTYWVNYYLERADELEKQLRRERWKELCRNVLLTTALLALWVYIPLGIFLSLFLDRPGG